MNAVPHIKYLHGGEVASLLQMTPEWTRHLANSGQIPRYQVINGLSVWIASEIEAFLADRDGWRQLHSASARKPERRSVATKRPSQSRCVAKAAKALACLLEGPQTSVYIAAQCNAYAPRLIATLRKQGHNIKTKRLRATAADGFPRARVALYQLVGAGS